MLKRVTERREHLETGTQAGNLSPSSPRGPATREGGHKHGRGETASRTRRPLTKGRSFVAEATPL